jgi:hypothetical protein
LFKDIEKHFSQDIEIMSVIMFEPRLCTLIELQTVYSLKDLYDFLEIIEVQAAISDDRIKRAEQQQALARNK